MITSSLSHSGILSSPLRMSEYYQMNMWDFTPAIRIPVFYYTKYGFALRDVPEDMYDHPVTLLLAQVVNEVVDDSYYDTGKYDITELGR